VTKLQTRLAAWSGVPVGYARSTPSMRTASTCLAPWSSRVTRAIVSVALEHPLALRIDAQIRVRAARASGWTHPIFGAARQAVLSGRHGARVDDVFGAWRRATAGCGHAFRVFGARAIERWGGRHLDGRRLGRGRFHGRRLGLRARLLRRCAGGRLLTRNQATDHCEQQEHARRVAGRTASF